MDSTLWNTVFFFLTYPVYGQPGTFDWKAYYGKPLHIEPLALSGSMGNSGQRTFIPGMILGWGRCRAPVYAVADGYVSTISVSPSGYGNALYVTHPNGTVSLYGHLHEFSPHIAAYVKSKQYEEESFRIVLSCEPEQFLVRKDSK